MTTEEGRGNGSMVVGLGNPGRRYERTLHNAGFLTLDILAERMAARWKRRWRWNAQAAEFVHGNEKVRLLKPRTYMNRSGEAVAPARAYWGVVATRLLVVLDDADLETGLVRVRPGGGSGGHRGLASVMQHVGGRDFPRVRIGIGRRDGEKQESLVTHVLKPCSADLWAWMERIAGQAAEAVLFCLSDGVESAMNKFNGQRVP